MSPGKEKCLQKQQKPRKNSHLPTPTTLKPWPNVPCQVRSLLRKRPYLMRNVSSVHCAMKTWRSPSRRCSSNGKSQSPQLVETINEKEIKIEPPRLWFRVGDPYNYCWYQKHWYLGKYFQDHSHGEIIMMVLTGSCSPVFAFYTYDKGFNDGEWILDNCTVKEPYAPGINMRFCNGICFQGKIYALSLQGTVAVIEEVDSRFKITGIGENRAVPRKVFRHFREYLVESEGEILLVFLVSRKSTRFVDDVEIFKLDISALLWVELRSIGGRALFLGDGNYVGVIASEVGCMKNCVCFSYDENDEWWVFDLENGKIEPAFGNEADVKE